MPHPLRTVRIEAPEADLDFGAARLLADEVAARELAEPVCLAWYDRARDRESPAHASECHGDCEMPGYVEYAVTRGAELEVVVGDGAYVFCYRPLGEFADC
ncbi:MAG TPA: AF1514 family protein [Chondromyces sp.]|nr:AF1514 family protein [Chondromyces sp.]